MRKFPERGHNDSLQYAACFSLFIRIETGTGKYYNPAMKHFILFVFLLTQTVGMTALFNSYAVYKKMKDGIVKFFLILFSGLSVQVMSLILMNYYMIAIEEINSSILKILLFFRGFSIFFMSFCAGYSTHLFYNVPFRKIKNLILLLLSLSFFVLSCFSFKIDMLNRTITYNKLIYLVSFLIIIIIYAVIVALMNRKNISGSENKNISNVIIILTMFFLPFFIFSFKNVFTDNVFPLETDYFTMLPFSFFYLILSGLFIYYINERYRKIFKMNISNPYFPDESFYAEFRISAREREIIIFILEGCDNKQIAVRLSISVNTVKVHIANIFKKLNVKSRFELIRFTKNITDNAERLSF